jgi:hypothetical protein
MDMKMVMTLRLMRKAQTPMEKSTAARMRYQAMGTILAVLLAAEALQQKDEDEAGQRAEREREPLVIGTGGDEKHD